MTPKQKYIVVGVGLVVAFACGRYLTPEKVKIETKIVEVEKKVKEKDTHRTTTVVEVTKPDGTKEVTTTIVEDSKTNIVKDKNTVVESKTERIGPVDRTTVSILAGGSFLSGPTGNLAIGGHLSRPVIGPISVGIWGLSNLTFGGSVGVQF